MFPRAPTTRAALLAGLVLCLACGLAGAGDLLVDAQAIAKREQARFPDGYRCQIDTQRHIVYVTALDDTHLRATQQLLTAYTDAHRQTLFTRPLPWNVTVVLPAVTDYRKLRYADRFDGYYEYRPRRLTSIDYGRTLLHEFTHALHHADLAGANQVHPIWVKEGLATLFEHCWITNNGLIPRVDTRLITLQRALRKDKLIQLDDLMKMGPKSFCKEEHIAVAYAQSRYLMYWLYERELLDDFYKRLKEGFAGDPSGRKALMGATRLRVFQIEPQWREWVGKLKLPSDEIRRDRARLGVTVADASAGVRIVAIAAKSAAGRTGKLRVGDVVTAIGETQVDNPASFIGALQAARPGQTVTITVVRHGCPVQIHQPLEAIKPKPAKPAR